MCSLLIFAAMCWRVLQIGKLRCFSQSFRPDLIITCAILLAMDDLCKILLTAGLAAAGTGLATYIANRCLDGKRKQDQIENIKKLLLTDIDLLNQKYEHYIRTNLLRTVPEGQIPTFRLLTTSQDPFIVYNTLIKDMGILPVDLQQAIIRFYQQAKAMFASCVFYSDMAIENQNMRNDRGLSLVGLPGDDLDRLHDDDIQQHLAIIRQTKPEEARKIELNLPVYQRMINRHFERLSNHYQFLLVEDRRLMETMTDIREALTK